VDSCNQRFGSAHCGKIQEEEGTKVNGASYVSQDWENINKSWTKMFGGARDKIKPK
jgi:hypothetical protein